MKIHALRPARAACAATAFARLPVDAHPMVSSPKAAAALIAAATTRSLKESDGWDTVSFFTHTRDAEAPCERRGIDQRREPRVERQHRIAVERQPLLVTPKRRRPPGDGLAVRQRASRLVHGLERPEALLADGGRGGGALGAAATAAERPGGERRGSDGSRHVSLNKKTRATTAAGGRFLAPCLTWRQYAANHHESSIVCLRITDDL